MAHRRGTTSNPAHPAQIQKIVPHPMIRNMLCQMLNVTILLAFAYHISEPTVLRNPRSQDLPPHPFRSDFAQYTAFHDRSTSRLGFVHPQRTSHLTDSECHHQTLYLLPVFRNVVDFVVVLQTLVAVLCFVALLARTSEHVPRGLCDWDLLEQASRYGSSGLVGMVGVVLGTLQIDQPSCSDKDFLLGRSVSNPDGQPVK